MEEFVLAHNKEGKTALGRVTVFGIVKVATFPSFKELREFAMGILGYCEYFSPTVPEVYLKAFENNKEDNNAT